MRDGQYLFIMRHVDLGRRITHCSVPDDHITISVFVRPPSERLKYFNTTR